MAGKTKLQISAHNGMVSQSDTYVYRKVVVIRRTLSMANTSMGLTFSSLSAGHEPACP
jgi:hypothetical protein